MNEAVDYLVAQLKAQPFLTTDLPSKLQLTQFIMTQYRQYEMLEPFLNNPLVLKTQLLFPLSPDSMKFLIGKVVNLDSYYDYDEKVIRDLLGKKLTQRVRKDLDDVSQKTGVPIMGCRRMFDNLKRVIKKVEDVEGPTVNTIMNHFKIPRELACQYANIMFINYHRLDTTKRRLLNFRFSDFEYGIAINVAASVFSSYFTLSDPDEIDASLSQDARDLKTVLFNHKESIEPFRNQVSQLLINQGYVTLVEQGGLQAYRILLKNILMLGASLGNGKEFRDLFSSIVEKVVDPAVSFGWSSQDLEVFLDTVLIVFDTSSKAGLHTNIQKRFKGSFTRLIQAIKLCAVRFYQV